MSFRTIFLLIFHSLVVVCTKAIQAEEKSQVPSKDIHSSPESTHTFPVAVFYTLVQKHYFFKILRFITFWTHFFLLIIYTTMLYYLKREIRKIDLVIYKFYYSTMISDVVERLTRPNVKIPFLFLTNKVSFTYSQVTIISLFSVSFHLVEIFPLTYRKAFISTLSVNVHLVEMFPLICRQAIIAYFCSLSMFI